MPPAPQGQGSLTVGTVAAVSEASPPSGAAEVKAEAHAAEGRLELYLFPLVSPAAVVAAAAAAAAAVVAFVLKAVEQLLPGYQAAAVVAVEVPQVEHQTAAVAAGLHLEMQQNTCHS